MAVFTKLLKEDIENFISEYSIGNLDSFEEIVDGIENSNFKIFCNNQPYILTIFEKRVTEEELPFFINLKNFLNKNNFECPKAISDKNGEILKRIKNKTAVIITFLEGKSIENPNLKICREVGKMVANLHNLTINFDEKRTNSLDLKDWKEIYRKCLNNNSEKFNETMNLLKNEIEYLENYWPTNIPCGVIHADLFRDNIFFKDEKISGVIDFYFSCYYFYVYDLAIVINDWCFDEDGQNFHKDSCLSILEEYQKLRVLSDLEKKSLNILLRAAAVRILCTRVHDYIFHPPNVVVVKKDPFEYLNILKWHQQNNIFE
ncbi:homoserine kinase [Pelagibacteraceae bacterium]|nr:homoserine kinase [Pelagibacteraceae bacterium]